jgi:hypothetical protein
VMKVDVQPRFDEVISEARRFFLIIIRLM